MPGSEPQPEGIPSLIGRIERLSVTASAKSNQDRAGAEWKRLFADWLWLSPRDQLTDLRSYFHGSGCDPQLASSSACFKALVPPLAPDAEKRLFFLALDLALPWLRNGSGHKNTFAGWRVSMMLELTGLRHGQVSLADFSTELGKSSSYLGRLFARGTGTTFRRYALCVRMARATDLLRDPKRSVKEVAASLGYADTSNFDREFHRALGVSPGEFREEMSKFKIAFLKVLSLGTSVSAPG